MAQCSMTRWMLIFTIFALSLHGMQENQDLLKPFEYMSALPLEQAVADIDPVRVKSLLEAKTDVSFHALCRGWMTLYTARYDADHTGNDPREFVKQAKECVMYLENAYSYQAQIPAIRPQVYLLWLQHTKQEEKQYKRTKTEIRTIKRKLKQNLKHTKKETTRCCVIL